MMVPKRMADGVQFECQGSGRCCVSHGEFGYVYLSITDRKLMAGHLNLLLDDFVTLHCDQTEEGMYHLKEEARFNGACRFLDATRCNVYEARPVQCRTWPFWPEVLSAKAWQKDVVEFCPGVGKGRVWSKKEIAINLKAQVTSEREVLKDATAASK